jgi:hypothetical protein
MNLRSLCNRLSKHLFERVIMDRDGLSPYLSRFYFFGGPRDPESAFDDKGNPVKTVQWRELPFNVYLHKFHRSDADYAIHNHPWKWSFSIVLAGGYREERAWVGPWYGFYPDSVKTRKRVLRPGAVNFISRNDFHRVELIEEDAWTLFVAGPRTGDWGFFDLAEKHYFPWREYIDRIRGKAA